jgi:cytochrome c biogenesis protein CcdA
MIAELASAAVLGLLTAISPCPLATNIAAVSYLGRHAGTPGRSLRSGAAYVAGRTICYTLLAAALAGGLLAAATASAALNRWFGLLVGPVLLIAGGLVLGLIPAPSFGSAGGRLSERLAARGDAAGAFLLGGVFALSFCPSSAALFFGSLVPLAARSQSAVAVPVTYGIATGIPVLGFAVAIALGGHGIGKAFDRVKSVEKWLRLATGVVLVGVGAWLSLRTNLGF